MKFHLSPIASFVALASVLTVSFLIGGCNSSDSSATESGDGAKGTTATTKATPPPNFDSKGLQAQQSAAQKASEEFRKKVESGQK